MSPTGECDRTIVRGLTRREEFLRAARGRKRVMPTFVLQCVARRRQEDAAAAGLGFTASKRVGKAVARNRARRRLREAARIVLHVRALPGHDYVLVARPAVLTCSFRDLLHDLERALDSLHAGAGPSRSCS